MNAILRFYWFLNRRFLAAFAEALVGSAEGDLRPRGKVIIADVTGFLRRAPGPVVMQVVAGVFFLPVWVPARLPRSGWARLLLQMWAVVRSHLARPGFRFSSPEGRDRRLETIFARLAEQAAEQEDDLVKSIVVLKSMKKLLLAAYLDDETTWKGMGYRPLVERDWDPPSGPDVVDPPRTAAGQLLHDEAKTPAQVAKAPPGRTTYCVIGSGAGGAVVAYYIQKADPDARVLLLEAGPLVTNDQFHKRLLPALTQIYMNAGVTLSADQKYIFLQGRAVGGSTTSNNALAVIPEGFWWDENIVRRWERVGVELDWPALHHAYEEVGELINVQPIEDRVLSTMSLNLREGFNRIYDPSHVSPAPANLEDCIGCGRCNYGCEYDAKTSMAVSIIPPFVQMGGLLVPDAKVTRIHLAESNGQRTVSGVRVETSAGDSIEIEADKFVLAAGCYASSKLLWRSGFTGALPGVRTVGKRFSGNFGTTVFARFPDPQTGWDGIQEGTMIHVPELNLVLETYFQPPGILGLLTPNWGRKFMEEVRDYSNIGMVLPIFGSSSYGEIKRGLSPSGFVIDYKMIDDDWHRLADGMKIAARAMFDRGATSLWISRFDSETLDDAAGIDRYFGAVGPLQYLDIETAHLQGGNVIHTDPARGVVDNGFKVHGIDNLWIGDASVIPVPITVNVQLTIMALARYAAAEITR